MSEWMTMQDAQGRTWHTDRCVMFRQPFKRTGTNWEATTRKPDTVLEWCADAKPIRARGISAGGLGYEQRAVILEADDTPFDADRAAPLVEERGLPQRVNIKRRMLIWDDENGEPCGVLMGVAGPWYDVPLTELVKRWLA
jgi:hypothetical protein